ncbi:interferon-induced protein with tetratricopeptide repeats 2-like [Ptychodera flava]|uniref:interferon-induced protein with tetratricopeptide repeats 2-like n=1 Tax=Ptychodera flava TaxID=63121 RepID=UPI00396A4DC6
MAGTLKTTKTKISLGQVVNMDRNISQTKSKTSIYSDLMIEDFSFKYELGTATSKSSYEAILKTLPCYFNWNLEESTDEALHTMIGCAEENLVSNTELTLVAHKTMLGYLHVTQIRRMEDRDQFAALSWFEDALSDNQLDIDNCSDNDGPLGDRLILLGNIAWVYFMLGRMDMVDKTLQNITQVFDVQLNESQKAFVYGHQGIAFTYFLKKTCDIGIACFNRALSVFPCHTDWLYWSGYNLYFEKHRLYGEPLSTDASSVLDREETLHKHVLENNSNHCFAKAMLASLFCDREQYDDAESIIDALKLNRTLPTVACLAAAVYVGLHKFQMSIKVLEQALEAWPNNTYLLCFIGDAYKERYANESELDIEQNYLKKAIQYYDKAIKVANGHLPWASRGKEKVLIAMGNMAEAHRLYLFDINTNRDPYWISVAYFELGEFCEQHLEQYSEALKYYQLAIDQGTQYWCAKRAARGISRLKDHLHKP